MDEITNETLETTCDCADDSQTSFAQSADESAESVDTGAVADTAENEDVKADEENAPTKGKFNLVKLIKTFFENLKKHEDLRQMVFFFLFSMICGGAQMIITYALAAGLKLVPSLGGDKFYWFIFRCDTQADFIGFLVGSIVGQVLTFVLNRKKTFNAPDYVALRATLYTIMAVLIIIMQTSLGNAVYDACKDAEPNPSGFLDFVFNLTGQAVAGISALIVNFLGNKFFVMRDWGKKKRLAQEAEAAKNQSADNANTDAVSAENAGSADEGFSTETQSADLDIQAQACCDTDGQTEE